MKVNQSINFNLHYSLRSEYWEQIFDMFPELPGYSGRSADGFHTWYQGELSHSIEPSGLQIFGEAT